MPNRKKETNPQRKRSRARSGLRSQLSSRSAAEKEPIEVSSTEAQNNFGLLLDQVARDRPVFIRRHRNRQAVLISIDRYEELTRTEESPLLDRLTDEFDALFDRMQSTQARRAADSLFSATSEELGDAAIEATRRKSQ